MRFTRRSWRLRSLSCCLAMLGLVVATPARAGSDVVNALLKGAVVSVAVHELARPLDQFINALTFRHGLSTALATRVVPVLSVGERCYIGAAQVTGPAGRVQQVRAVLQVQVDLSGGKHRAALYIPSSTDNPLDLTRVPEVGVTALIDSTLWGKHVGPKGGDSRSDLIRAAVITGIVAAVGDEIDRGLRAVVGYDYESRVVPHLQVGEKGYLGLAQVVGAAGAVGTVDAVATYEDHFNGKYRVRLAIPINHLEGVKLSRVEGVGMMGLILTTYNKDAERPARAVAQPVAPVAVGAAYGSPGGGYVEEDYGQGQGKGKGKGKNKGKGPPAWAPAHGYRAKQGTSDGDPWYSFFALGADGATSYCLQHRLSACAACQAAYQAAQQGGSSEPGPGKGKGKGKGKWK